MSGSRIVAILCFLLLFCLPMHAAAQASTKPQPENLGPNVNTEYPESNPKISPDGKTLYFTRWNSPENLGYKFNKKDQDIWFSTLQPDGSWTKAKNMGPPVNTIFYNSLKSISPDGNTIVLSNRYNRDGSSDQGVSISHRTADGWSFPEPLEIADFVNQSMKVDYFMTNDGKELLMSIEREGTFGDRDLYVSFLEDNGTWTKPLNLGGDINTSAVDGSPFLAADGVTLYFASFGHGGYGGSDVFVSRRLDSTWIHWSKPENLGPTINSAGDDSHYSISAKGDCAYFVSNRSGYGDYDVFRIATEQATKPKPVILVSGHTYNQKTNQPIEAEVHYEILPEGTDAGNALSNAQDGAYKIVLPVGKNFGLRAEAKGFVSVNENVDATATTEYTEMMRDLYLAPIEENETVRLNNIFFETAKADLRPESFAELDRVVKFLKDNSTVSIEIKGYTDNVGDDDYNLKLSEARAKSALTYLVSKGIDAGRLSSKGFGKTMPVASNYTGEGRQQNRRVEFTIVKD